MSDLRRDMMPAVGERPALDHRSVDAITHAIAERRYPWCRARLMHALAGAEEQGILEGVIDELIGSGASGGAADDVYEKLRDALWRNRWMR